MKKIIRKISLFLVFVLFASCNCNTDKPNENNNNDGNQEYDENRGIDINGENLYIVNDGRALYSIVISENADECEKYAADEMKSFISQITDVDLSVVTDKNYVEGNFLSIGKTSLLATAITEGEITTDFSSLNNDGFIIKIFGNAGYICGDISRGTLYGVYDFLEKFGGVKFLTYDYTYVPKADLFCVKNADIVEVPAFARRNYLSDEVISNGEFMARMRFVSEYGSNDAKFGYGFASEYSSSEIHSLNKLVPVDLYLDAHPEWFNCTVDNKDKVAAEKTICLTNGIKDGKLDETMEESVAKTVIDALKIQFMSKPTMKFLIVSQPDNTIACQCEKCRADRNINGGISGTLIGFLNVVSDELIKWKNEIAPERELYIVTLAYQITLSPPAKKVADGSYSPTIKARDNIIVEFAPIEQCFYHSFTDTECNKQTIYERIKGWQSVCNQFQIWDYSVYYDNFLFWYPNYHVLKDNALLYKDINVRSLMTQGANQEKELYQEKLRVYLTSKLYWNPYRNVNKLIEDFNNYYFGEEIGKAVNNVIEYASLYYAKIDHEKDNGFHLSVSHWQAMGVEDADNYSIGFLENFIKGVDKALDKLEENKDGFALKDYKRIESELCCLRLYPMEMILKNYTAYYDPATEDAYAKEFFKYADKTNLTYIWSSKTLLMYKSEFDLYD